MGKPFSSVRAVIFDLDGLLLDTERRGRKCWERAASDFGYDTTEVYPSVIGRGVRGCDEILRAHFGPDAPLEEMRRRKTAYVSEITTRDGIPVKRGAPELLHALRERPVKTALATSSERSSALSKLEVSGLSHAFDAYAFGDEVTRLKPSPDIFLLAAERLSVPPSECLVLEDSPAGIRAAVDAGMRPAMIPDVLPPEPWIVASGIPIHESLMELLATLLESGAE